MPLQIESVDPLTEAFRSGMRPDDLIFRVNGFPIEDNLDWMIHGGEEFLEVDARRRELPVRFSLTRSFGEGLGIVFKEDEIRECGNRCPFCFCDQQPKEMRKELYIKDDDYRFSFRYGHFITMTNFRKRDIERIFQYRLSPLYVSVHATGQDVRNILIGIREKIPILEKLKLFVENKIQLHTQIVVCPGINDGEVLEESVRTLASLRPGILSVSVVPLGMTKKGNSELSFVDAQKAGEIVDWWKALDLKGKEGFVQLSDEWFVLSNRSFPPSSHYDNYSQYENGVGNFRYFLDQWEKGLPQVPRRLEKAVDYTIVTGKLAGGFLKQRAKEMEDRVEGLSLEVSVIPNGFFGGSTSCAGLLTGEDIVGFLREKGGKGTVALPSILLRRESELLIDNWTVEKMRESLGRKIEIFEADGDGFLSIVGKENGI